MFLRTEPTPIAPEAILDALANEHDRCILALAQARPVDAQDIIQATGMPKSTAYRRIQRLREDGLIHVETGGLRDGHAVERYRTTVTVVSVAIEDGEVTATWRRREAGDEAEATHSLRERLSSGPPAPGLRAPEAIQLEGIPATE